MPSPIYESLRQALIGRLAATLTALSNLKLLNASRAAGVNECKLGFKDQCKVVYEGIKRGFTYDGCTAVPDFDFGADCCGEHDYHYQSQEITRAEADRKLRECLQRKGYIVLPWVYWLGVKTFGWVFWNRRKRN